MFENSKLSTRVIIIFFSIKGDFILLFLQLFFKVHLISTACNPSWNPKYPFCVNKIYIQSLYEAIKINGESNSFLYTNLKTKVYDQPIVWKNNIVLNAFDHFSVSKTDWTIEVE